MTGDALDVDAHAAGRIRVEHLRATGYLSRPQTDTRHRNQFVERKVPSGSESVRTDAVGKHATPESAPEAESAVGCRWYDPTLTEYEIEWLEERAGILEFDGGVPRMIAEWKARRLLNAARAK